MAANKEALVANSYQGRAGTDIATVQVVSKQRIEGVYIVYIYVIRYFYQLEISCCRKLCFQKLVVASYSYSKVLFPLVSDLIQFSRVCR